MVQITFGPMTPVVDAAKDAYAAMPSALDVRDRAAVSAYQTYKDAEGAAKSAYAAVPSALDVRDRAAVSTYQAGVDATRAVKDAAKSAYAAVPSITFGPAMPLRDPPLTLPPPNAPVYSMENKFSPAVPQPPAITNTVFPKGGVPMPATQQQQQAFGILDAMQANQRKQDEVKRDYGPWWSFAERAANQYGNNVLAIPAVAGDLLSAPFRDLRAMGQGAPPPAMFGATPRPTVEGIASGARAAQAAARGEDPGAAYDTARANIDMARNAMQQQFPVSQIAGSVAGDIGTLIGGRMPFTRLPGVAKESALASEAMAPGAMKQITKAWESVSGRFGRPLAKAAETGVEGATLAILNEGDPIKTGLVTAGGQLGGSGALWAMHSPRAYVGIGAGIVLYSMAQRLIPGGDNKWGHAVQASLDHAGHALITGLTASALGAGRFKGSPHLASKEFAQNLPLIADGLNVALRTPAVAGIADYFRQDQASAKPVVGPLLNKMMSDPGKFTTQELEQISSGIQNGTLKATIDRLLQNDAFRQKAGL